MDEDNEAGQIALGPLWQFARFRAHPFPDPITGGLPWAIGYGSTRDLEGNPVTSASPPISEVEANQLAMLDMLTAFNAIEASIKVPLTQCEKIAIKDFIYDVGAGTFGNSTLFTLINRNQFEAAARQLELRGEANGEVVAGLLRRHLAEETAISW